MWELPSEVHLCGGTGLGRYPLLAFDRGLMNAGVGDYNMMRVSSIFPPFATCTVHTRYPAWEQRGTLMPIVYSEMRGQTGMSIACAIAIAIPMRSDRNGAIFEASGEGRAIDFATAAEDMAVCAMQDREEPISQLLQVSREILVERAEWGAVVCCAVMRKP